MANKTEKSTVQLIIDGQQSKVSLKEMGAAVAKLKQEYRSLAEDHPDYAETARQLQTTAQAYNEASIRARELGNAGKELKSNWKDVFTGFLGGNAVSFVIETLGTAVNSFKTKVYDMSDSLADVGKKTGLTKQEVKELNEEMSRFDTRTFNKDLRSIAEIGGSFDVPKQDLAEFVKSTDMLNIAFGDQFDSVEDLSTVVLKLRNIFSDIKSEKIGDDVLHIGNAMNVLESKGAATGKVMADFAGRIGGVAIPMGFTTGQVLGLSATLENLNVTAERGSTAVNTILQKMLGDVEGFAKVAGMSTKEFTILLNTDLYGAFKAVAKGAKDGGTTAVAFAKILKDTELAGSGASEVLMKVGANVSMLDEQVGYGTAALKDFTSVTDEVAIKNNNAAAIIDKMAKAFDNVVERAALFGMQAIEAVGPWLMSFGNLSAKISENSGLLQILGTAVMIYYANTIRATAATIASTTAQIANRVAVSMSAPVYSLAGTGLRLMTISHQLLTGQITLSTAATRIATMATRSLNAVWLANPLGIVIAGLSAAIGLLKLYSDNTREALALEKSKHMLSVALAKTTHDNEKAQTLLNESISDYNSLSDQEQQNLRNEVILRRQKLVAQLKNIEAQKAELTQQASAPSIWQKFTSMIKGSVLSYGNPVGIAQQLAGSVGSNIQAVNEQFNGQIDALKQSLASYDQMTRQMDRMDKSFEDSKKELERIKADAVKGVGAEPADKKTKKKKDDTLIADRNKWELAEEKYDQKRADRKAEYAEAEHKFDQRRLDDLKTYMEAEAQYDQMMAEREAKKILDDANNKIGMSEATGQITPDAANLAKLDAEETYLASLFLIRQSYGQETADLEQSQAEASIARAGLVAKAEKDSADEQREIAFILNSAKAEALEQGVSSLKNFFKETSMIYKALFLVEKAAAIANVIIKSQAEIAAINASAAASLGPFAAPAYAAAMTVATKIRTGISVATIAAQSIQSFIPGREEGGFTDMSSLRKSKSPAGYVSQPTLFDLGPRSYIAGENYKTEYVIPEPMLQDPYFKAQAEQMERFRTTGKHPLSGSGSGSGSSSGGNVESLLLMQIEESRQLRMALQSGAIKLVFNSTQFEEHTNYIDFIRESTSM